MLTSRIVGSSSVDGLPPLVGLGLAGLGGAVVSVPGPPALSAD
jgi:hypothetical protein